MMQLRENKLRSLKISLSKTKSKESLMNKRKKNLKENQ